MELRLLSLVASEFSGCTVLPTPISGKICILFKCNHTKTPFWGLMAHNRQKSREDTRRMFLLLFFVGSGSVNWFYKTNVRIYRWETSSKQELPRCPCVLVSVISCWKQCLTTVMGSVVHGSFCWQAAYWVMNVLSEKSIGWCLPITQIIKFYHSTLESSCTLNH